MDTCCSSLVVDSVPFASSTIQVWKVNSVESGLGLLGFSSDSWWAGQAAWQAGAGVPRKHPSLRNFAVGSLCSMLVPPSTWAGQTGCTSCILMVFGLLGKIRVLTGEGREAYLCSEPFLVKA